MKQFISLILCAAVLTCLLCSGVRAEEADILFSVTGAEASPGGTVEVTVDVDKNAGTWSMLFEVCFGTGLKLIDVKNGSVFKDGDFMKSPTSNPGYYRYAALMNDPTENNYNTGLILTLYFEIEEDAKPGDHKIWLRFPDGGVGWFFDAENPDIDRTVPADGEVNAFVTVTGIPGDLNGDGKVNATDGNMMKKVILGIMEYMPAADLDGDGKVNVSDSAILKKMILGII